MKREDWDRRYADAENLWAAKPNRFLVAEAEGLEPRRALDLACGEGQNAIWLATLGWDVTGVDFSEVAIAKARRARHATASAWSSCAPTSWTTSRRPARSTSWSSSTSTSELHERRQVPGESEPAHSPRVGRSSSSATTSTNLTDGVGGPSDPDRSSARPTTSPPSCPVSRSRRPSAFSATSRAPIARRSTRLVRARRAA